MKNFTNLVYACSLALIVAGCGETEESKHKAEIEDKLTLENKVVSIPFTLMNLNLPKDINKEAFFSAVDSAARSWEKCGVIFRRESAGWGVSLVDEDGMTVDDGRLGEEISGRKNRHGIPDGFGIKLSYDSFINESKIQFVDMRGDGPTRTSETIEKTYDYALLERVLAHEFGHVIGLAHTGVDLLMSEQVSRDSQALPLSEELAECRKITSKWHQSEVEKLLLADVEEKRPNGGRF